jgi:hypothetical protein
MKVSFAQVTNNAADGFQPNSLRIGVPHCAIFCKHRAIPRRRLVSIVKSCSFAVQISYTGYSPTFQIERERPQDKTLPRGLMRFEISSDNPLVVIEAEKMWLVRVSIRHSCPHLTSYLENTSHVAVIIAESSA